MSPSSPLWPKQRPILTQTQTDIMEDWESMFLRELPSRYEAVAYFNHHYPQRTRKEDMRTLEIGAGTGTHIDIEKPSDTEEYVAIELRDNLAADIREKYPHVRLIVGDCQEPFDIEDRYFDRVLAIHVLEHLDNLPATLAEVARVMKADGTFSVVIPCEGGAAYRIGRYLTSQRRFEKRYKVPYKWMIEYDHINNAREVMQALEERFKIVNCRYYPSWVPSIDLNLLIGITLTLG